MAGKRARLENAIERIVLLTRNAGIGIDDLAEFLRQTNSSTDVVPDALPDGGLNLRAMEKGLIVQTLRTFGGSQSGRKIPATQPSNSVVSAWEVRYLISRSCRISKGVIMPWLSSASSRDARAPLRRPQHPSSLSPSEAAHAGATHPSHRAEIICALCPLRTHLLLPLQIGIRFGCGLPTTARV